MIRLILFLAGVAALVFLVRRRKSESSAGSLHQAAAADSPVGDGGAETETADDLVPVL